MGSIPNQIMVANLQDTDATSESVPMIELVTDTVAELIVAVSDTTNAVIEQQEALRDYIATANGFMNNNAMDQPSNSWVMETGIGDMILESIREGITKELPTSIVGALSDFYLGEDYRETMGVTDEDVEQERKSRKLGEERTETAKESLASSREIESATKRSARAQEDQSLTLEQLMSVTEADIEERRIESEKSRQEREADKFAQQAIKEKFGNEAYQETYQGLKLSDVLGLPDENPIKRDYLDAIAEKENRETAGMAGEVIKDVAGRGIGETIGGFLQRGQLPYDLGGLLPEGAVGNILSTLGGSGLIGTIAKFAGPIAAGVGAMTAINSTIEGLATTDREATKAGQTFEDSISTTVESKISAFFDPTLSGKDADQIYQNAFKAGLKGEANAEAVSFQKEMLKEYGVSANESFKMFNDKVLSGALSADELKESMDTLSEAAKDGSVNLTSAINLMETVSKTIDSLWMLSQRQREELGTEIGAAATRTGLTEDTLKKGMSSSLFASQVWSLQQSGEDVDYEGVVSGITGNIAGLDGYVTELRDYIKSNPEMSNIEAINKWVNDTYERDDSFKSIMSSAAIALGYPGDEIGAMSFLVSPFLDGESKKVIKQDTGGDFYGGYITEGYYQRYLESSKETSLNSKSPDRISGVASSNDTAVNVKNHVYIDGKEIRSALSQMDVDDGKTTLTG